MASCHRASPHVIIWVHTFFNNFCAILATLHQRYFSQKCSGYFFLILRSSLLVFRGDVIFFFFLGFFVKGFVAVSWLLRLGLFLIVFVELFFAAFIFNLVHFVFAALAHFDNFVFAAFACIHHSLFAAVELLLACIFGLIFAISLTVLVAIGPVIVGFLLALRRDHLQARAVSKPTVSKEERRQLVPL
jgi:hypothetical protein